MTINRRALKESVFDTIIAATLNIPLNYIMITVAFAMEFNALQTTLFMTSVFTVFAITRKYFVRVQFSKRDAYAKKKESRLHT